MSQRAHTLFLVAFAATIGAACDRPSQPDSRPTAQLDVDCPPLDDGVRFEAPEPWMAASPAYIDYAAWLGSSPYRTGRTGRVDIDIKDLVVFDGTLYLGIGDSGYNAGSRYCARSGEACPYEDAPGHGMPVLAFTSPADSEPTIAHILHEEAVDRFRPLGDQLLVPGIDPTRGDKPLTCQEPESEVQCPDEPEHERFNQGAFHRLRDGQWLDDDDAFEEGMHIYDNAELGGCLFAAGATKVGPGSPATVWSSCDDGATWHRVFQDPLEGSRRMYAIVPVGHTLVAFGSHYHEAGVDLCGHSGPSGWVPCPDAWAPSLHGTVRTEVVTDGVALAWNLSDGQAMRLSEVTEGVVTAEPVELPQARVHDAWLGCDADLLLLTSTPAASADTTYAVYRTSDLHELEELVSWTSTVRYGSLALWNGQLILGDHGGVLHRAPVARTSIEDATASGP